MRAVVPPPKPKHETVNQTRDTQDQTNGRPPPIVEIHRQQEQHGACKAVDVRHSLIDWFGNPHEVLILLRRLATGKTG